MRNSLVKRPFVVKERKEKMQDTSNSKEKDYIASVEKDYIASLPLIEKECIQLKEEYLVSLEEDDLKSYQNSETEYLISELKEHQASGFEDITISEIIDFLYHVREKRDRMIQSTLFKKNRKF